MRLLFLFHLYVICLGGFAQPHKSKYEITYRNFGVNNETNSPMEYFVLTDGVNLSVGFPQPIVRKDSTDKKQVQNQIIVREFRAKDTMRIYLYKNFSIKEMYFETGVNPFFKQNQIYKDSLGNFTWVLHNDHKFIGDVFCNKATTNFRGRNYTAWYSPNHPISEGPWKFDGLPGLIFEVYDTEKIVYWQLASVVEKELNLPEFPRHYDGTYNDFRRVLKERYFKLKKVIESNENNSDPSCITCKQKRTLVINFPENILSD